MHTPDDLHGETNIMHTKLASALCFNGSMVLLFSLFIWWVTYLGSGIFVPLQVNAVYLCWTFASL